MGPRHASVVRAVGILSLVGLFVLLLDAQWMKIDDFGMSNELSSRKLGSLLADIVTTRTTPHVRFAFLHHLLVLLPVFRLGETSRTAINVLYLLTAGLMLAGGLWLARPLARRPLLWGSAWLAFAGVAVSIPIRTTLEFKTAGYLLLCFAMCAGLVALAWRFQDSEAPPPVRRQWLWCLFGIGCMHAAEVSLFAVACVGFSLALQRRLRWALLLTTLGWPLVYWGANKLFFPRPMNLLENSGSHTLPLVLRRTVEVLWKEWAPELVLALVLLLATVAVAVWRARPGGRLLAVLRAASMGAALMCSGIGVVFLANANFLWVSERHVAFAGLCLVGSALACAGLLVRHGVSGWGAVLLAAALAGVGGWTVQERLPRLLSYADARRQELADTFFVQAYVKAEAAAMVDRGESKELLVFIPRWHLYSERHDYIDPSFMGATWTLKEFARGFSCPPKRACASVTYLPNLYDGPRTKLDRAQQLDLCGRMRNGRVMVLRSSLAEEPPPPELPTGFSDEQCLAWLEAGKLITPG
ncbi:hypothetical protein [Pyxidicoccus trucidator]|uniref:hypothetical protein n=1 Tax=Pyxidicoccus trucidator TaxID=2709662 RepID=UPI0013DCAD2D|nr:hypothetical protein [Pyxidicoccus trucidator]